MHPAIESLRTGTSSAPLRLSMARVTGAITASFFASCASAPIQTPTSELLSSTAETRFARDLSTLPPSDILSSYRRGGFLVAGGDIPFVGSVGFLAGPVPESTLVIVAFSLPSRALTFTREGERYRASYDVVLELRRDSAIIRRDVTHQNVRVGSFKETTRDEESVVFQQLLFLAPGPLSVNVSARDAGSTRAGTAQALLVVPRLDSGMIAPPLAVYRVRARKNRGARPNLVVSPRATAVFGRDSTADFYAEYYGAVAPGTATRAAISVFDEGEHAVFADTVVLTSDGGSLRSAIVRVPVGRIGFGVLALAISDIPDDSTAKVRSVARTPLLVTLGDGLAVSSFEQMIGYLRFFTAPERLAELREAPVMERPRAWAAFVAATDPLPSTSVNEGLRDYLSRLADANIRFREETLPGWLTDRGMIFSSLGEPDNLVEPGTGGDPMQRSRVQVWEYQRYHSRFVFVDQTGFGHWRLTPSSEAEYRALTRRVTR